MPKNERIALIGYQEPSIWMSCQKINAFLIRMYKTVLSNKDLVHFTLSGEHYDNLRLANEIISQKINHLIFYDHRLNPNFVLEPLIAHQTDISHIKVSIHLYGNPFEKIQWWSNALSNLGKNKIQLITSSSDMAEIAKLLFKSPPPIFISPFGVSSKFKFDEKIRKNIREKFKLNNEKVFLYTGRISPRKNIHLIIELFNHIKRNNDKLFLVGPFDNYNSIDNSSHDYQFFISELINKIDPKRKNILYISKCKEEELINFYNMSDYFINLSTMPGDDFGMSIAEAACNGLPILLTKWAGHKDHLQLAQGIEFVEVLKNGNDQTLSFPSLKSFLKSGKLNLRDKRSIINTKNYGFKNLINFYKKNNQFTQFEINKKLILKELMNTTDKKSKKLPYDEQLYS